MSSDRFAADRTADRTAADRTAADRTAADRTAADRLARDDVVPDNPSAAVTAGDDHAEDRPTDSSHSSVLVGAVAAVVATALAVLARVHDTYRADRRDAYAAVDPSEQHVADTPVCDVEYRDRGTGTPVLVSHGIVGGCDQAIRIGSSLVDDARILAPSRFGYLGTGVSTYPTPSAQARAFAELLDDRGVDDAVVVGTSAGAPAAIRFALSAPERTRGLVLLAAATPPAATEGERDGPTGPPTALLRDPVFWLLLSYAPWLLRRTFGVSRADWAAATPAERDRVDALFETLFPVEPRREGVAIDTAFTNPHVVDHPEDYDPAELSVPTLVVHARDDPLASFADAEAFADRAPNATLRAYDTGGHLVFGHGDDVRHHVTAFASDPEGHVANAQDEPASA